MNEEKLKQMAELEYNARHMQGSTTVGCDMEPKRACLRDRVRMDLNRAMREERRGRAMMELDSLLEKHPDIARILDLIEEIGR